MTEILKTSLLDLVALNGRGNEVRFVVYNPATGRTEAVELSDLLTETDSNARQLKIVTTQEYSIESSDRDKILLFLFDEGIVTVTVDDGLYGEEWGEFILVAGEACVLELVGDGVSVRKAQNLTNTLRLGAVGRIRRIATEEDIDPNNLGFHLYGGFDQDTYKVLFEEEFPTGDSDQNDTVGNRLSSALFAGLVGDRSSSLFRASGEYIDNAVASLALGNLICASGGFYLTPFAVSKDLSVDELGVVITSPAGNGKIVVYNTDQSGYPTTLALETSSFSTGSTGYVSVAATFIFRKNRVYWIGLRTSSSPQISTLSATGCYSLGPGATAGSTTISRSFFRSVSFASGAPNPWTYTGTDRSTNNAPLIRMRVV